MELGRHLRELWLHRTGLVISIVLASLAAMWSVSKVSIVPLKIEPRSVEMAGATTRVLVDTPKSFVIDLNSQTDDIRSITNRALLVSNVMGSAPVRDYIVRRAGVPAGILQVSTPVTPAWPRPLAQGSKPKRTGDILASPDQYRLSLQSNPTVPIIDVYAQAPTADAAEQLANGTVAGMQDYMRDLSRQQAIPDRQQVRLEQLGLAKGSVINSGVSTNVALLSFLLVLAVSCAAVLFISRVRRGWVAEGRRMQPTA